MGYKIEFNWVLKLKPAQGLEETTLKEGEVYNFEKSGSRAYPVAIPIDLVNENWEAVARVVINEFTNTGDRTCGKYKTIKIYNEEEREFLTKYWSKNV